MRDRSRFGDWWARNFVKRRFVLSRGTPVAPGYGAGPLRNYVLVSYGPARANAPPPSHRDRLAATIGVDRLSQRLADPDLALFLAVAPEDDRLGGFVWALAPRSSIAWHDNVPVRPGTALLFHGFVFPEHRRLGLFTGLMAAAHDYCLVELGRSRVNAVVEASNTASLRALKRIGYEHVGDNHLLKFYGVNVVSMLGWRERRGTEVHFVLGGPRGRNH